MKSYTDLSQGKKLAEILPLESVDMYYQYVLPKSDRVKHNPEIGNPISALEWYNKGYTMSGKEPITMDEYCVPCWSLAALLNLLPSEIIYFGTTYKIQIRKYSLTKGIDLHQISYGNVKIDVDGQFSFKDMVNTCEKENLVDACVDMIYILKEMNYEK